MTTRPSPAELRHLILELIHLEPDVAHCRGCAADSKAAG